MSKNTLILTAALLVLAACDTLEPPDSNHAPEAEAGVDQTVFVGEVVTVSGLSSSDPDGDELTYSWALTTKPDTSSATLSGAGSAEATFTPDVPGTYVVLLTVTDGKDQDTDEVTVTASYDLRLSGTFSADTTLHDRGAPYTVASHVVISGGTMTIAPGVRIEFAQSAQLTVGTGGVLKAVGTATDTIRFVGSAAADGHWEGIEVVSASPLNELKYVEIAHGGANDWAGLWVWNDGAVKVTNSLIRNSSTVGVENRGSLSGWSANTLRDNVVAGIGLTANTIRYLDATSTYAGGSTPYALRVAGSTGVGTAGTWPKTDKPYLMASTPILNAAIVVEPGVRMAFEQNHQLAVASGGSLNAVGTSADTIRFYGTQATQGFWEGIEVSSASTSNELTYVEIAHGGANGWAGLWVWNDGTMKVTHSLIRHSATSGVENRGSLAGWAENTLRDNVVAGIDLEPNTIRYLDAASTYAGGSTPYALRVSGTAGVGTAATWPKTDKPYLVTNTPILNAAVTIQAGASLWFEQNTQLIVSSGSLTAAGTASDSITIRGVEAIAGFWDGIEINSLSSSNSLEYVRLGYGGANNWANLWIWDGNNMSVSNSLIHDSAACGVEARGTYVATNVSYANNAAGDVCN